MTSNSSGTDVEPIDGLRWELLCWAGLDGINPTLERKRQQMENLVTVRGLKIKAQFHTWNRKLSLSLQESSICLDELLRLHYTPRISMVPSAEVSTTPSRLLKYVVFERSREAVVEGKISQIVDIRAHLPCRSIVHFVPVLRESSRRMYTHINVANRNSSGHFYGGLWYSRWSVSREIGWAMKIDKVQNRKSKPQLCGVGH
jgi:hypothetical protein